METVPTENYITLSVFFVVVDILTPGTITVAGLDWSCDTLR